MFFKSLFSVFSIILTICSFCQTSAMSTESFFSQRNFERFKSYAISADIAIRVEDKCDDKIVLYIIENNVISLKKEISNFDSFADFSDKNVFISKDHNTGNLCCRIVRASKDVDYSFLLSKRGDIELSPPGRTDNKTGQAKFAFLTYKVLNVTRPIAFHSIYVSCNGFHNSSVFKAQKFGLFGVYFHNSGVVDSRKAYLDIPPTLDSYESLFHSHESTPECDVFDNYGTFVGDNVRFFEGLTLRNFGIFHALNLSVERFSLFTDSIFDVVSTLSGSIDSMSIGKDVIAHVENLHVTEPIKKLSNDRGAFHISSSLPMLEIDSFENNGAFVSESSLNLVLGSVVSVSGSICTAGDFSIAMRGVGSAPIKTRKTIVNQTVRHTTVTHYLEDGVEYDRSTTVEQRQERREITTTASQIAELMSSMDLLRQKIEDGRRALDLRSQMTPAPATKPLPGFTPAPPMPPLPGFAPAPKLEPTPGFAPPPQIPSLPGLVPPPTIDTSKEGFTPALSDMVGPNIERFFVPDDTTRGGIVVFRTKEELENAFNVEIKVGEDGSWTVQSKKAGCLCIREDQEWKLRIEGYNQQNVSDEHKLVCMKLAIKLAKNPNIERVYLDMTIKTITEDKVDCTKKPDVVALRKDGRLDMYERPSPKQSVCSQIKKLEEIRKLLPEEKRGIIDTI